MGCICILKNSAMPDLIIIGYTQRTAQERADELSRSTGIPTPFEVAYEVPCEDPERLEREIHRKLAPYRYNSNREFFQYPADDAHKIIKKLEEKQHRNKELLKPPQKIFRYLVISTLLLLLFLLFSQFNWGFSIIGSILGSGVWRFIEVNYNINLDLTKIIDKTYNKIRKK